MTSDLFLKFGKVTYMAIFDCEWHSLTENVSLTDLHFNVRVNKIILKIFQERERERERERGWMTCLRFYVLYIITVSSGRWGGDNRKHCAMKPRLQLKRFPSPASVGSRARDGLIIKPALNPHSVIGRMRQRDRATANERDRQIIRERERERERER